MAMWILVFILALIGALCCAAECVNVPGGYASRIGAFGALLIGIAVILIAMPNLGS